MKRLSILGAVALVAALALPASASPTKDPTIWVANADGSVTVSTTATTKSGCIGQVSPTKGSCDIHEVDTLGTSLHGTDGGPTVIEQRWLNYCPCTFQFWVHGGQPQPYSAVSAPYVP